MEAFRAVHAHAGELALGSAALNALMCQYDSEESRKGRLDISSQQFYGLSVEAVADLVRLCPVLCPGLKILFVPENISRQHWETLRGIGSSGREGPFLHMFRGMSMQAFDAIMAQAGVGVRLDLTGPEFAGATATGVLDMARICQNLAHIEEIFVVPNREVRQAPRATV